MPENCKIAGREECGFLRGDGIQFSLYLLNEKRRKLDEARKAMSDEKKIRGLKRCLELGCESLREVIRKTLKQQGVENDVIEKVLDPKVGKISSNEDTTVVFNTGNKQNEREADITRDMTLPQGIGKVRLKTLSVKGERGRQNKEGFNDEE